MQRFFDILFSGTAIIVLYPLLIPVMVILRFTGEGEVFYRQKRVGKDGRMFYLLKFATMLKDSPFMGTQTVTIKDDPRILPFGKFLRKTKIKNLELPQLINILKGDMSLIGPRPQTRRCFLAFPNEAQLAIFTSYTWVLFWVYGVPISPLEDERSHSYVEMELTRGHKTLRFT